MRATDTKPAAVPTVWPDHYSDADRDAVADICDWISKDPKTHTRGWIRRAAGENNTGAISAILAGKYSSPPGTKLAAYLDVIQRHEQRKEHRVDDVPVVETSVYKVARAACVRARTYRAFAVVSGYVGTGKSTALRHYAETTPGVVYLDGDPDMSPRAMMEDLGEAIGAVVPSSRGRRTATREELFRACCGALADTDRVIILDEAENCAGAVLTHLRRIRDKARVGVVLAGTERLEAILRKKHGQFDQIYSRTVFWSEVIRGISSDDCAAVCRAAFGADTDPQVLDACWSLTGGSVRMLVEGLIPAVRDYGLHKGQPLTAALVYGIGKKALGLTRTRTGGR